MAVPTLLDIARLEAGAAFPLIEESVQLAPELRVIPAEIIDGNTMQLTVQTGLPSVAFRNANEGTARTKANYEARIFQCHILDHQVAVDIALVKGLAAARRAAVFENHAAGVIEAAFGYVGSQTWYGTGNDAKGFPGMIAQMADDATHVVDAGGNSAKTSVWFVAIGRETVQYLFGNGTTIGLNGNWDVETILDASNNPFQAYVNYMTGTIGLRLANKNSVVRIKNIEEDTHKLSDTLMYDAFKLCLDLKMMPTRIFMNSRSLMQLRAARTATNATGAPAPLPRDWEGIPIEPTNSIGIAET